MTRVGGLSSDISERAVASTAVARVAALSGGLSRTGGMASSLLRVGGAAMGMSAVCDTDLRTPYLELRPVVVWVLDGWAYNDVFSNTTWGID